MIFGTRWSRPKPLWPERCERDGHEDETAAQFAFVGHRVRLSGTPMRLRTCHGPSRLANTLPDACHSERAVPGCRTQRARGACVGGRRKALVVGRALQPWMHQR